MSKYIKFLFFVFVTLTLFSCRHKEILSFGGKMEKFTSSDADSGKTYLGHAEQWIYWEEDDDIMAYVGDDKTKCTLVSGSGSLDAFFKSDIGLRDDLPTYAIYPWSAGVRTKDDLIFPASHPYRATTSPAHPDSSFGRGSMPMVAYKGADVDSAIYFHAVTGILRIQLFSSSNKNITSIQFKEVGASHSSVNKQISGPFLIHDITRNMPYLEPTQSAGAVSEDNRTITISMADCAVKPQIGSDKLLTFYLPLPATGASNVETYILEMTVSASDNTKFVRTLRADIHRRNITMMPALKCTSWTETGSGSLSEITLVGSGTKDRPFQIYTAEELKLVRDAFNAGGTVTINGQEVHGVPASASDPEGTYFKVVRSDIKLVTSTAYAAMSTEDKKKATVWDAGINNFRGYMYFASSTATNGGITNESNYPIFQEILADGQVEKLFVKGTSTPSVFGAFSPLCNTNRGTMIDCHNKCTVTLTDSRPLAGICVNNYGYIQGGANEAALQTPSNVAGICYNNYSGGLIQGNFSISSAIPKGTNVGGICYNNSGIVRNCLVSASTRVEENGNWGIICYNNNPGGIIDNCISTGTIVYTIHGSVGGICNINSGIVRNCSNMVEIRGSSGNIGGIVATMDNAYAEVYNCKSEGMHFIYGAIESNVADNCGGIVGRLDAGKISNCYNHCRVEGATNTGGIVGFLANSSSAVIQNCWSGYGHQFCGYFEAYDEDNSNDQPIGEFCFSAAVTDAKICSRIVNEATGTYDPFEVVHMIDDQDWRYPVELGNNESNTYDHMFLGRVLNGWVEAKNAGRSDDEKYFVWTTDPAVSQYPRYDANIIRPETNKKSKRR